MEKPRKATAEKEKNKLVIPIGKVGAASGSGGGIGVGLIFLGGAMAATAFAFLFRRRRKRRKPGNVENYIHNQPKASTDGAPWKFIEEKNKHEDRDFSFDALNSPSRKDMDQNLRNGSSCAGVREADCVRISEEVFFWGGNDRLEVHGRNEECRSNGEDVIQSNSPKVLNSNIQIDAYGMEEENNDNGIAIVDQDIKEGRQEMLVNPGAEKMDANSCKEEDMGELHCQDAAETTKADQSSIVVVIHSRKEQASPIHCQEDQGNDSYTILAWAEVEEKWEQNESSLIIRPEESELNEVADKFDNVTLMFEQRQENRVTAESADDHASIGNHQKIQQMDELGTCPDAEYPEEKSAIEELTSDSRPTQNYSGYGAENGFKEVQQPAELILVPEEKLQLLKDEGFVQKQSLVYLNRVEIEGRLKYSLLGRYILQLVELTHQTTNSHKRRILVFTVLVLSGSMRVWYFSRPFLKILLMHLRNYLIIKLHLWMRTYLRSYGRIKIVPKMVGI